MQNERFHHEHARLDVATSTPPAVESFFSSVPGDTWPEEIAANESFREQVETRQKLQERLDAVLSHVPNPETSMQEAIALGEITEAQAAELYSSLSGVLTSEDYRRIALYLPFEFIPDASTKATTKELQQATDKFRADYMSAWKSLLHTHDVRANFVDGDVLEVASREGDLPRVVKAAHLIPKLVERGLLKTEDVLQLMEETDNEILKQSIADTLPVLKDLGLLAEEDTTHSIGKESTAVERGILLEITPQAVQEKIQTEFHRVDGQAHEKVTEKRGAWLKQKEKEDVLAALADDVRAAVASGKLTGEMVEQFLAPEVGTESRTVLVEGIRMAIESSTHAGSAAAEALYAQHEDTLRALLKDGDPQLHEALAKMYNHLHRFGLVDERQLTELGIALPSLDGAFSKNLDAMTIETQEVQNIAAEIESSPELAKDIYPVVLMFGSRLKGYGAKNADIDVGVFVRPGTPVEERSTFKESLQKVFSHEKIHGEVVEFWLEETEEGLGVKNFDNRDASLGDSTWTHILFGAAWEGNASTIRELREKLLVPYMDDTEKTVHGRDARGLYLEEMERDTLQYRLMHKGYDRFYPSVGRMQTPHADAIDGQSAFWDSGYRRLATKLYANRVFLPKIEKPK